MKYKELDFKGGIVKFDIYKNYPESDYFDLSTLSQDMMVIEYNNYTIDLGHYHTCYMIAIITNTASDWKPFYTLDFVEHQKVFDNLQKVIDSAERY